MRSCSGNNSLLFSLHEADSPYPSLLPKHSLHSDDFSPPGLRLQVPRSTAPNPCLLLSTKEENDYFSAEFSTKPTWQSPVSAQEEEEEDELDRNKKATISPCALLTGEENDHFCAETRKEKLHGLELETEEVDEEEWRRKRVFSGISEEEEEEEQKRAVSGRHHALADNKSDGHHLLVALLKDCTTQNDIDRASTIHMEIVKKGLFESRIFVGNSLIDMYAKLGMLEEAEDVFGRLPFRTVVAWTILIAGYSQHGHAEKALGCFEQMQCQGVSPNRVTYLCILKACADLRAGDKCKELHLKIVEDGLEKDTTVGTGLLNTYAKCGFLEQAQEVFDKITFRNVVSYGALLSAFVQYGRGEETLEYFAQMQHEGLFPNAVIFISVLKACGSMVAIEVGKKVHSEVLKLGFLEKNVMLVNALLEMYVKCNALIEAQDVFNKLQIRDLVSWNLLITGYAQQGPTEEQTLTCFEEMQHDGFSPDTGTYVGILKACGNWHASFKGEHIHSDALKRGMSEQDPLLVSALTEMYIKCGLLAEARNVFNKLSVKSVVLWNALIAAYTQHGCSEETLKCYDEMQVEGFSPNAFTLASIFKACANLGAIDKGQGIHLQLDSEDSLKLDVVASTALMDMYAKCGLIGKAQEVFDKLSVRDLVSWSALITGYAEEGCGQQALECYEQMQLEGLIPNLVTFVGALKACGRIGAALKGREIHEKILQQTSFGEDILVWTSLIDMYGKCGLLVQAKKVFSKLPARNEISWNALLAAYSQHGESQSVFRSYHAMIAEGLTPSTITFTIVFNTCSHAGLLDSGQLFFDAMNIEYGLSPTVAHYNCMIDMFGRAGQLEMTVAVVQEMPVLATLTGWHIVLAASQRYEPDTEAFDFLADRYTAAGSHKNSEKHGQ